MIVMGNPPPYKHLPRTLMETNSYSLTRKSQENRIDRSTREERIVESRRSKSRLTFAGSKCGRHLKTLEGTFSDKGMHLTIVQPGYVMAKRNSGINVMLNMEELCGSRTKEKRKSSIVQDERDVLIKTLQQERNNLTSTLTEERNAYRLQLEQFLENTKIDVEVMQYEHREHVKAVKADHREEIEKMTAVYEAKLKAGKDEAVSEVAGMQEKVDSLNETLKLGREEVACEMEEVWNKRKKQLEFDYKLKTEELMEQQKLQLLHLKKVELNHLKQEHGLEVEKCADLHRKEMNTLLEKMSVFAADAENLRIVLFEAQKLKEEVEDLREVCARTKEQLRKTHNELADAKVKLQGYELSFSEKVSEVEERYSLKIHGLMLNNRDIRRNYMKKCAEFLDVQTKNEQVGNDAKSRMKTIILARTKANISLVTPYEMNNSENRNTKRTPCETSRPKSAPTIRRKTLESDDDRWTMNYRPRSGPF